MSDDYSGDYTADGEDNHPALRRFNRPLAMVKHVLGKAIKWAAIGAIGGAVVLGLIASIPGGAAVVGGAFAKLLPWIGDAMGGGMIEKGGELVMSVALKGLTFGAIGGLALGGLSGAVSAGNAADEAAEAMVANDENRRDRTMNRDILQLQHQQQLMALQQQKAEMMGGSPLPAGMSYRGQDGQGRA